MIASRAASGCVIWHPPSYKKPGPVQRQHPPKPPRPVNQPGGQASTRANEMVLRRRPLNEARSVASEQHSLPKLPAVGNFAIFCIYQRT